MVIACIAHVQVQVILAAKVALIFCIATVRIASAFRQDLLTATPRDSGFRWQNCVKQDQTARVRWQVMTTAR